MWDVFVLSLYVLSLSLFLLSSVVLLGNSLLRFISSLSSNPPALRYSEAYAVQDSGISFDDSEVILCISKIEADVNRKLKVKLFVFPCKMHDCTLSYYEPVY